MSYLQRLVKPSSVHIKPKQTPYEGANPLQSHKQQTPVQRINHSAGSRARFHVSDNSCHAARATLVDWLTRASQTRAHEHVFHPSDSFRTSISSTHRPVRDYQWQERRCLSTVVPVVEHAPDVGDWHAANASSGYENERHAAPQSHWLKDVRKGATQEYKMEDYPAGDLSQDQTTQVKTTAEHGELDEVSLRLPDDPNLLSYGMATENKTQQDQGPEERVDHLKTEHQARRFEIRRIQTLSRRRAPALVSGHPHFDLASDNESLTSLSNIESDLSHRSHDRASDQVSSDSTSALILALVGRRKRKHDAVRTSSVSNAQQTSHSAASASMGVQSDEERLRKRSIASKLPSNYNKKSSRFLLKRQVRQPESKEVAARLGHLASLLAERPGLASIDAIWSSFEKLQYPQVQYLKTTLVNRMFAHLARVEYHNTDGARDRVLSLYRQCVEENVQLHKRSWTAAMVFAGRGSRGVMVNHLQEAVEIWMQMEDRGVRGDYVTFNVLFDIAAKAKRFDLAETFLDEIKARRLPINRYLRCSMIYCAGLRRDPEAVRFEFERFVRVGEIVDTSVMNCVISSLILAGDGEGAENTFENMKALQMDKSLPRPVRAWQDRRQLARRACEVRRVIRRQQEKTGTAEFGPRVEGLQALAPLGPDEATYRILIKHHVLDTGNILRIKMLLSEMASNRLFQHGSIYEQVFRGFSLHGGVPGSMWTMASLENMWKDFVALLPEDNNSSMERTSYILSAERAPTFFTASTEEIDYDDAFDEAYQHESDVSFPQRSELDRVPYFSVGMAKSVLSAFYVCCGKHRMLRSWLEIRARWKNMNTEEYQLLARFVHSKNGQLHRLRLEGREQS